MENLFGEIFEDSRKKESRSSERIEGAVGALFLAAFLGTLRLLDLRRQAMGLIGEGVMCIDEDGWVSDDGYLLLKDIYRYLDNLHDDFTRDEVREDIRELRSIANVLLKIENIDDI